MDGLPSYIWTVWWTDLMSSMVLTYFMTVLEGGFPLFANSHCLSCMLFLLCTTSLRSISIKTVLKLRPCLLPSMDITGWYHLQHWEEGGVNTNSPETPSHWLVWNHWPPRGWKPSQGPSPATAAPFCLELQRPSDVFLSFYHPFHALHPWEDEVLLFLFDHCNKNGYPLENYPLGLRLWEVYLYPLAICIPKRCRERAICLVLLGLDRHKQQGMYSCIYCSIPTLIHQYHWCTQHHHQYAAVQAPLGPLPQQSKWGISSHTFVHT